MSKLPLHYHPITENGSSLQGPGSRLSLFDHKDSFIERISPVATAAIYFGGFSLAPQDISLSRQALLKLSFLYRFFLQPGGLRVAVDKQTTTLSGVISSRLLVTMGELLARQIEGIRQVRNQTTYQPVAGAPGTPETAGEAIQFLFATDQTLRTGVRVLAQKGRLVLNGTVLSLAQKTWAEQVAAAAIGSEVDSHLEITGSSPDTAAASEPPQLDDESLQALVLFRLRLVRETEHLPVKVKAHRGTVILTGKVSTEALRQRVENLTRSTLGIRELRSSLGIVS